MPDDAIESPDTRRADRLPPGQRVVAQWPAADGPVPAFDPAAWDFAVFPVPLVDRVVRVSWGEFQALPRVKVFADVHSADRWSRLDNLWEGVPTRVVRDLVAVSVDAAFVMAHAEYGLSTNLSAEDFFAEDAVFATHHNGEPLAPEHGGPVRLVVPRLYDWKSLKWVRGVEFMVADRPGYWESERNGGRPTRGDPWAGPDGERVRG